MAAEAAEAERTKLPTEREGFLQDSEFSILLGVDKKRAREVVE